MGLIPAPDVASKLDPNILEGGNEAEINAHIYHLDSLLRRPLTRMALLEEAVPAHLRVGKAGAAPYSTKLPPPGVAATVHHGTVETMSMDTWRGYAPSDPSLMKINFVAAPPQQQWSKNRAANGRTKKKCRNCSAQNCPIPCPKPRLCYGCGSKTHLIQLCPTKRR